MVVHDDLRILACRNHGLASVLDQNEMSVAYLVYLESNGSAPGVYHKLVNNVHEGLTLLSQSTGWDDYDLYECEMLFSQGNSQRPALRAINESILGRLPDPSEVNNLLAVYYEYQHGDLPWKATDCRFLENVGDIKEFVEMVLPRSSFLAVLKAKRIICQMWKDEWKALLNG